MYLCLFFNFIRVSMYFWLVFLVCCEELDTQKKNVLHYGHIESIRLGKLCDMELELP